MKPSATPGRATSPAETPPATARAGPARRLSPTTLAAALAVQRHHADRLAVRLRAVPPPADA